VTTVRRHLVIFHSCAFAAGAINFPPVPDGGVTGPFNVLTAGLSVLNYTNVVTALALHNGPGGMTAKWPGSNMTVQQMVGRD
jgi:hypothetical protein